MAVREYPLVVIGAGAAGLVIAIGAAKAKKKVLLIEAGNYGGDCTNFGCIPSKSLIASSHVAYSIREAREFGIQIPDVKIDTDDALKRVREIVTEVKSHEIPEALEKLGVETLTGKASFIDKRTLEVETKDGIENIRGKKIVIATGSTPFVPEIPGLNTVSYYTNETIFSLQEIPKTMVILGGGPIGSELAQAFQRLGSEVTIVGTRSCLLPKDDEEARTIIQDQFKKEGIQLYLGYQTEKVYKEDDLIAVTVRPTNGETQKILFTSCLLIAVGRRPHIKELKLDQANIKHSLKGIEVDVYGRTSQKHIFCVGDASGAPFFTHMAESQARAVLTTLLIPGWYKKKIDRSMFVPHVTFTSPEVASFGPPLEELENRYPKSKLAVYTVPFSQVDRAVTNSSQNGFVKVITKKWSSQILGATIVGERAGEMILELLVSAKNKIPLRKLASVIHPYPTYSQAIRKAADKWLTETFLPSLNEKRQFSFKRWIPIGVILLLMLVSYFTGLTKYFDFQTIKENREKLLFFVNEHPVLTPFAYILLYILLTALSIPGATFVTITGGFLFPQPWSTLYTLIGATIGATFLFLAARFAFKGALLEKAKESPFFRRIQKGFEENEASYLLFLRLVPLFPFWLVNLAPAFLGVSLVTFIWTTFVGIIPGTFVYTQAGAGLASIIDSGETFSIKSILNKQVLIALTALGIFALVPTIYKAIRNKRNQKNGQK